MIIIKSRGLLTSDHGWTMINRRDRDRKTGLRNQIWIMLLIGPYPTPYGDGKLLIGWKICWSWSFIMIMVILNDHGSTMVACQKSPTQSIHRMPLVVDSIGRMSNGLKIHRPEWMKKNINVNLNTGWTKMISAMKL